MALDPAQNTPPAARARPHSLAVAAAGIVLIPYATVLLPGARLAFVLQAAGILAVVLAALGYGAAQAGLRRRVAGSSPALAVGVAAWALATFLALVSAVVRGNEPVMIAGQALAMGLLPLGALAAATVPVTRPGRALAGGIVVATVAACVIHLGVFAYALLHRQTVLRLYLANDVAAVNVVMLALLLVLAGAIAGAARPRVAIPALVAIGLYVLGSGVRSLWLVVPAAVGLFVVASGALRLLARPRIGLAAAALPASALAVVLGFNAWITTDRPTILPGALFEPPVWQVPTEPDAAVTVGPDGPARRVLRWTRGSFGERPVRVTAAVPVEPDTAYLLAVELAGDGHRGGRVFVMWADESGGSHDDHGYLLQNAEPGRGRQRLVQVGISPKHARTAYIALGLRDGATSSWTMYDLRLRKLGSPMLAVLYAQATFMGQRMGSLAGLADPTGQNLEGISGRFGETRFLLEQVRDAGLVQKLFGAGLGARYPMKLRDGQDAHYIHNFYAFLLYKTGIVGTVLVLAAMSLWIGFTFVAARRARDPWRRAFLWAVFSAWIGYAVWSLACPEILDFRMAPIWGFVVAVTGQTDREEREAREAGDVTEASALAAQRDPSRRSPVLPKAGG